MMDNMKVWGKTVKMVRSIRVEKSLPNGETICENHYDDGRGAWWRLDSQGNAITRIHDMTILIHEFESLWKVATIEE